MRLSHEARAERREQIRADAFAGATVPELEAKYGLTQFYIRQITKDIPRPPRVTKRSPQRIAQLSEIASLGLTRRKAAKLLRMYPTDVSAICRANGIKGFEYDLAGWAPIIAASRERAANMVALYTEGRTLEQIGQQYGITRERVRQLMSKHFRTNGESGGRAVLSERRRQAAQARKDAACIAKHGCTVAQYKATPAKAKRAYIAQRRNAGVRKIEWHFNFWTWWTVWQASGHWEQRGRGQGYVMCRNGDVGPYSPANVHIATAVQNVVESSSRKKRDPSLPVGVKRTKSGRYSAQRHLNGKKLRLGTHDTPDLAYAAYLRAANENFARVQVRGAVS